MNRSSDENVPVEMTQPSSSKNAVSSNNVASNRTHSRQPRYLQVAWILLLLLGVLFVLASILDLVSDAKIGIPSDHLTAFQAITGISWMTAKSSATSITHYVTTLEVAYAVHELVFGLLFLLIVAIPFRRRARWAWWACWIPMLTNLTYTFTIAHYSSNTLVYSLIPDIALPILLLVYIPAFFGSSPRHLS
ncbi:MAG TPA: hypothetical protein DHW02_00015 [Ktedonobacter sp.]|nr:hypothetical protein [Ktedonobacter sp.]